MEKNRQQIWDKLDPNTKEKVKTAGAILFCVGLTLLGLHQAEEYDKRLDLLCGDDRSKCTQITVERNCAYAGVCNESHWELKPTERK